MTLPQSDYSPSYMQQTSWSEASKLLGMLQSIIEHEVPDRTAEPTHQMFSQDEAYRYCEHITRRHSRSFFLSSQFLPPEKRRAIRALYAFCRTSDDMVDQPRGDAHRELAYWVALAQAPLP